MRAEQRPCMPVSRMAFCATPAAKDILRVIAIAIENREIATVVGAQGIGKTAALKAFAANNDGARYCEMKPTLSRTTRGMLTQVCDAVNAAPKDELDRMRGEICDVLVDCGAIVLLIDEAQYLDRRCLEILRGIHKRTRVPLVFAGVERHKITFNTSRAAEFPKLASRVETKLAINATTAEDVDALAAHYGIGDAETLGWLKQQCVGTGSLRTMIRLIVLAMNISDDGEFQLNHLERAAAVLRAINPRRLIQFEC